MKKAVCILAPGFEEIEAVTPVDILRRAGLEVVLAGVGGTNIKGARGITIVCDVQVSQCTEIMDAVILPGGMPGAENLAASNEVKEIIMRHYQLGKIVAAICASPAVVLAPLGILDGKKAVCYPGCEKIFGKAVQHVKDRAVVVDGSVVTSAGAGTAFEFGLALAGLLAGEETAQSLAQKMVYS